MKLDNDLIYRIFNSLVVICVISVVIYSCNPGAAELEAANLKTERNVNDTVSLPAKIKKEPALVVNYHIDSLQTKAMVDSFKNRFTPEQQHLIFALNRVDAHRLNKGDVLIIPDTLTGDLKDYSPFPATLDILDSIPQTVLVSQRIQGFALYENGQLVKWGPVSSGKRSTPTPNGLNYGNYRAREKVSTINSSWLMPYYFNFMNFEGVGVHQYELPGYPASHACVRLRNEDAIFIYNWAKQWKLSNDGTTVVENGTPFMVFGEYDFEDSVPWLRLAENHKDNFLNSEEMETLRDYVEAYFEDDRNFVKPEADETLLVTNEVETKE